MTVQSKVTADTLASAMAAAFAEIEGATKDSDGQVGQQKYKYADLTAVIEAIKPPLIKHNLFFTQHPKPSEGGVTIETILHHASGEHYSLGELFVPANKQDAQGYGSALTYARRYALVTAFGVPVEDDDGNAAARGTKQESAVSPPQPITDAELAKVMQLVEATSANVPVMLQYLGIGLPNNNLAQLTREQHDKVLAALTDKLAKMAKAETDAKAKEPA